MKMDSKFTKRMKMNVSETQTKKRERKAKLQ